MEIKSKSNKTLKRVLVSIALRSFLPHKCKYALKKWWINDYQFRQ